MPEELLPKPQTDLPLPRPPETVVPGNVGQAEKEIPAHLASQGDALQGRSLQLPRYLLLSAIFAVLLLITGAAVLGGKYYLNQKELKAISDFESCAAAGNPVMESYPATCRTTDGRSFTQVLSEEEQKNLLPPDPTANWKTYEDLANNFQIKYPSTYIKCTIENEENLVLLEKSNICAAGEGYSDISISVVNEKSNFQTSEFPNCYSVKKENITIAGIKGIKYSSIKTPDTGKKCETQAVLYSANLQLEHVVLENDGKIYEIATPTNYDSKIENYQILSTIKFTDSSSVNFLEIPEYGVKIPLTQNIMDAYYLPDTTSKGYVYLKVHSLDKEPYCNDNSSLGVAALSRVGKDEIDQRTGKKFSDSGNGTLIGNYYYYIDLSQAVCSQKSSNLSTEVNARKEFDKTSKNIEKL